MKWLPKKVHEKGLSFEQFQKQMGISHQTAVVYLRIGQVPTEKRYRAIASVLDVELEEVYEGFRRQLISEGKEKTCKECSTKFIDFRSNHLYCSDQCRIEGYKKVRLGIGGKLKADDKLHWKNNPLQAQPPESKEEIKREELDDKISEYLMKGNRIDILPEQPVSLRGYGAALQHKLTTTIDTAV